MDGTEIVKQSDASSHVAATDLLLTASPVKALRDELAKLSSLGAHFSFINTTIFIFLNEDAHADALRATLDMFNRAAYVFMLEMDSAFRYSREFYTHSFDEFCGKNLPTTITDAHVRILLDPEFQNYTFPYAGRTAASLHKAATILRQQVIPLLPNVQEELASFVEDYSERHHLIEERKESWLPSYVQSLIWGEIEPVRWNIVEVKSLPGDALDGGAALSQLPDFCDRMHAHFSRLAQLNPDGLSNLGYSSGDDFKRLYASRLECAVLLSEMHNMSSQMERPFLRGRSD